MIKSGVDLSNLQPQMAIAYTIACFVYQKHNVPCVITSAFDDVHKVNTLHQRDGICRALDLRTNNLQPLDIPLVYSDLKNCLGDQFDVVLDKDHVHIEFDVHRAL